MARNTRSPSRSLGLAAQTGWIGAVARFWELVTFVEPFHRMFFISNINIQYPHALKERVPVTWGIFYGSVVPLICLVIWLGVSRAGVHKFHVTILGLLISIVLTLFITDCIKNAVGRPRPDLISRC